MKSRTSRFGLVLLLLGYIATMTAVLGLVFYARDWAIATFTTPEAQQQWDTWRATAEKQSKAGPVQRRPPKSTEVPSLVLLRDYFPVVIAAAIVFTSALYVMFVIAVRGAFAGTKIQDTDRAVR